MELAYPPFTPEPLRYRHCPICTGHLVATRDADDHFRPRCAACGWTYYPPNGLGVNVIITAAEGVVFLLPPGEPPESPAALPGGHIEFGETPEQAAVREAREETGLAVEVVRELGRWFERDTPIGLMLSFIFETRAVGGTLRDGLEGRVAVFPDGVFPAIAPGREGRRRALAAYLVGRGWRAPQERA